jgi:glycosyltransferase involved in cell wall biosynthesis
MVKSMAPDPVSESLTRPGVSVIIAAYNYARFLPQAIDSVLRQDYSPCEIVVVDDGSTDNTAEVVAPYAQRVRYIRQTNAGLSAARNRGIHAARFDYVAFLDADDEWLPAFLRRAMETFAGLPEEFAVVACAASYVDLDGKPLETKRLAPEQSKEITCRDILLRTRFMADSVVVKRAVFKECGRFDDSLRSSEDRDLWARIAARRRIFRTADRLALIRKHATNMSKQADRMECSGRRVVAKAYLSRLVPRSAVFFWLKVISFHYFQSAWMYYEEDRRGRALGRMALSILLWPFFFSPGQLNEPACFRLRAALRFCFAGAESRSAGPARDLMPCLKQPEGGV